VAGEERLCLEVRRHGVVLFRPLVRAVVLAGVGAFALALPWPVPVLGAVAMTAGAVLALTAVWRWDRTRLVVTTRKVVFEEGILRRRESAVLVRGLASVGLERPLLGRLLGYGTVVAGPLRVAHVAAPREVSELLEELMRR
jgi:uncharacterized membrane protein YdbT with pleckstrin-like domain